MCYIKDQIQLVVVDEKGQAFQNIRNGDFIKII